MGIGDRQLKIAFNHMLMFFAGDWPFPSKCSKAFNQISATDGGKTHYYSFAELRR